MKDKISKSVLRNTAYFIYIFSCTSLGLRDNYDGEVANDNAKGGGQGTVCINKFEYFKS